MVGASNGVPVYVEQVADRPDRRRVSRGVARQGTKEAVGGVVVARTGVNTKNVIDAVKARIAQIQPDCPRASRSCRFTTAPTFIEQAIDTLRRALVEEIVLVTLAHVVFLMHFRSILIVTIPLPLAVLISFLGMYYAGISSNIMSLAGIAIAIGVLVDAGIVVTENAFRFMEQRARRSPGSPPGVADRPGVDAARRPAGVLLDGDHPAGLHSGVCAHRPGRQAVPPAGVHQDVRRAGGDGDRRHARAGAVQPAARRARSTRRTTTR